MSKSHSGDTYLDVIIWCVYCMFGRGLKSTWLVWRILCTVPCYWFVQVFLLSKDSCWLEQSTRLHNPVVLSVHHGSDPWFSFHSGSNGLMADNRQKTVWAFSSFSTAFSSMQFFHLYMAFLVLVLLPVYIWHTWPNKLLLLIISIIFLLLLLVICVLPEALPHHCMYLLFIIGSQLD